MNIFYCCGVLEPQKKIWWKNFLVHQPGVIISKKFSSDVTHVIYGRDSTSSADILKAIGNKSVESLVKLKVVHCSWLLSCMKSKKMVPIEKYVTLNVGDVSLESCDDSKKCASKRSISQLEQEECSRNQNQNSENTKKMRENCEFSTQQYPLEPLLRPPKDCVRIGSFSVAAYGVGTLAWGVSYPDESQRPSIGDIEDFIGAAVSTSLPHHVLIDTADSYCIDAHDFGFIESVMGNIMSLKSFVIKPFIASKGGMIRVGRESNSWREANYVNAEDWEMCIRETLSRLRCDALNPLPLWQVHHCKPQQLAAVMTACRKLVAENLILHVGLCNVSVADVEFCQQYLPIASVQNPYSLWDRTAERHLPSSGSGSSSKRGMLEYCSEHSIPFLAYGVLGGLAARRGEDRWQEFPELLSLAEKKNLHVTTLVLSMMRHRFPCLLPLIGTRRKKHVVNIGDISSVRLTQSELDKFPALK